MMSERPKKGEKRIEFEVADGRHDAAPSDEDPLPKGWEKKAAGIIEKALLVSEDKSNHNSGSVYNGELGVALTLLILDEMGIMYANGGSEAEAKESERYIQKALNHCDQRISSKRVTFLEGRTGDAAVSAALYHRLGKKRISGSKVDACLAIAEAAADSKTGLPPSECEVLYGRCGILYSILFLRRMLQDSSIGQKTAAKLVRQVIEEGDKTARACSKEVEGIGLYYVWHNKCYFGAAHGLCGIYHMLLHFPDEVKEALGSGGVDLSGKLKSSIDALLAKRFPSYNMPSSYGSDRDKLIHWCHGAPGFVPLCILAYKVYGEKKYLNEAKNFGEVIWKRGMLNKKGMGLCHGAPGNGLTLLSLYRATGDEKWLRRAQHFAVFVIEKIDKLAGYSDNPYSLFTGVLGAVVFLAGVLKPDKSWFVGYEV